MKKRTKIIGIILVIVFAYIYAHVEKPNMIYDKHVDSSEYVSLGILPVTVEQEFVCEVNRLDAISVKCQMSGDAADMMVKLTVYDVEDEKICASAEISALKLKDGKFNSFSFEPIEGCKDRVYKVSLCNIGDKAEEGLGAGFVTQPLTEEGTKLSIGNEEKEGTLIMKTVTKGFDVETFCVVLLLILYIIVFFKFLIRLFSR